MWWMVAFILSTPAGIDRADVSPASDSAAPKTVQLLIEDLDDPQWRVRETTTESLIERGPAIYDAMRAAFVNTSSYEVRRRIGRIVEEIYVTDAVGPAPAFLGIKRDTSGIPDPRIPGNAMSELVTGVITCTAAERAGIRAGDLIMSLDGEWITDRYPAEGFVRWIENQRPGTPCRLGSLRGGLGFELREELRPLSTEELARIEFDIATQADDARVPSKGAGLLIKRDAKLIDLRTGDLILAIDRTLIPAGNAKATFDEWARRQSLAPDDDDGNGLVIAGEGPAVKTEQVRSLHVLRGGTWFYSDVKLGRRPARVGSRARESRIAAYRDFQIWWRETFDPTGLVGSAGSGGIDAEFRRQSTSVGSP